MQQLNSSNYQTIVRDTILQVFPRYDLSKNGQIPINKLLPFTQEVFQILHAPPMTNQEWTQYSKDVDLNADNQLSKMQLFFAIKTYFYKKIKIEKEFDYPDFDDIGKSPGYSNATQFDNRLKSVIDNTYQQHTQNQGQNQKQEKEEDKGGFGFVPKKEVTGFLNNCLNKMGVQFKVTEDQTNQAIEFLANNLGNSDKEKDNNTNINSNSNNSNNGNNKYPNNQNNNNSYGNNKNNNNYNSSSNNNSNNQGADKMDIFMTIKNLFNK